MVGNEVVGEGDRANDGGTGGSGGASRAWLPRVGASVTPSGSPHFDVTAATSGGAAAAAAAAAAAGADASITGPASALHIEAASPAGTICVSLCVLMHWLVHMAGVGQDHTHIRIYNVFT